MNDFLEPPAQPPMLRRQHAVRAVENEELVPELRISIWNHFEELRRNASDPVVQQKLTNQMNDILIA